MSDVEWDAEDFEPQDPSKAPPASSDKWEGEDEEDVKDNWDDEEEEKHGQEGDETKAVQVKKKKSVKDKIAEKEAARKEQLEKRKKDEEESREAMKTMTPDELAAEKLRRQKLQEEADLELAKETFGMTNDALKTGIDACHPVLKEDFDQLGQLLKEKLTQYEKSGLYVGFLENLFRDLTLGLESEDVKKLGSTLNALSNEKAKQEKPTKGKKKSKKANLTVGKGAADDMDDLGYNEYDDFI